jgi:hypothetical protein
LEYVFLRSKTLPIKDAGQLHMDINADYTDSVTAAYHTVPAVIFVKTKRELTNEELSQVKAICEQ